MSHHDGSNDKIMEKFFERYGKQLGLGSTERFPEGKLTPHDEGEIRIAIGTEQGNVIMHFGKEIAWIGFNKVQAKEIAKIIMEKAESL